MSIETDVYVSIAGGDVLAGRMHAHRRRSTESATFIYAESYLGHPGAYPLDPSLPLASGAHQTPLGLAIFSAFADSAPDRWGRSLIKRRERRRAVSTGVRPRSLGEVDFLLGVRDDLRQGAIRFQDPETAEFVASDDVGVPSLNELSELLAITERVESGSDVEEELQRLVRAGSSLGGSRPKTHVKTPDGRIAIAKFPAVSIDTWNVMAWEKVAFDLAANAGITVPYTDLVDISGRSVLIVYRFDRALDGERIGYRSALTMLEARDREQRSYLDIGEVIEERSPSATEDLQQLWRRIAFFILVSNTDDHLRNHAFLHVDLDSWRLSPAFDLNPNPESGPKYLSTAIDDAETEARIDVLLEVAPYFRLDNGDALTVLSQVVTAVVSWRSAAKRLGLSTQEITEMEPAFEHDAAGQAASLV